MSPAIHVLVVDDEDLFRNNMVKLLGLEKDLLASSAASGEEALEHLRHNPCDVVLLDVKMPGLMAQGTLRRLREMGCTAEVVIVTGHASVDDAMELIELGAFDYLLKPCSIKDVIKKIHWAYESLQKKALAGD